MNIANLIKRKTAQKSEMLTPDLDQMPEPNDINGYMRRGWLYHSRGRYKEAEADFRRAINLDPESVDGNYELGLNLKAQGRKDEAIEFFKKAISLIEAGKVEDKARREMLRRLSLGHVNQLTQGDWNLEHEIWHRQR